MKHIHHALKFSSVNIEMSRRKIGFMDRFCLGFIKYFGIHKSSLGSYSTLVNYNFFTINKK